jgi:hypothetical protein
MAHIIIALVVQLAVSVPFGMWAGALAAIALFYGREHSQEERKAAESLMINHADLIMYRREWRRCLWPPNWTDGNRWDFYGPALAVTVAAGVSAIIKGVM